MYLWTASTPPPTFTHLIQHDFGWNLAWTLITAVVLPATAITVPLAVTAHRARIDRKHADEREKLLARAAADSEDRRRTEQVEAELRAARLAAYMAAVETCAFLTQATPALASSDWANRLVYLDGQVEALWGAVGVGENLVVKIWIDRQITLLTIAARAAMTGGAAADPQIDARSTTLFNVRTAVKAWIDGNLPVDFFAETITDELGVYPPPFDSPAYATRYRTARTAQPS